jgi:transketolase
VKANIVSVPCFDLFEEQSKEYKEQIISKDTKVLAIEASRGIEYYKYADDVIGMESFGASAPADKLFKKFGFTIENVMRRACNLVGVEYREVNLDVNIY